VVLSPDPLNWQCDLALSPDYHYDLTLLIGPLT